MINSQEEKQIKEFYSQATRLLVSMGILKNVNPSWAELLEAIEHMAELIDIYSEEYHPDDITE